MALGVMVTCAGRNLMLAGVYQPRRILIAEKSTFVSKTDFYLRGNEAISKLGGNNGRMPHIPFRLQSILAITMASSRPFLAG
jgi:hypothetical protein